MFQRQKKDIFIDGCQDINLKETLIKVMERNTHVLNAKLDTQNMNSQLEREQHKG